MEADDVVPGEGVGAGNMGEDELGVGGRDAEGRGAAGELADGVKEATCYRRTVEEGRGDQLRVDLEELGGCGGFVKQGEEVGEGCGHGARKEDADFFKILLTSLAFSKCSFSKILII